MICKIFISLTNFVKIYVNVKVDDKIIISYIYICYTKMKEGSKAYAWQNSYKCKIDSCWERRYSRGTNRS